MKKDVIIFLDIDGVLDSYNWFKNPIRRLFTNYRTEVASYIDRRNLFWVSLLCRITKAKIVLSSSWRHGWNTDGTIRVDNKGRSVVKTDKLFKSWGLHITSITPNSSDLKNTYETDLSNVPEESLLIKGPDGDEPLISKEAYLSYARGGEILTWIEQNNYTGKYLILEDDVTDVECFVDLRKHLIKTSFYEKLGGFGFRHLIKSLIKLINQ